MGSSCGDQSERSARAESFNTPKQPCFALSPLGSNLGRGTAFSPRKMHWQHRGPGFVSTPLRVATSSKQQRSAEALPEIRKATQLAVECVAERFGRSRHAPLRNEAHSAHGDPEQRARAKKTTFRPSTPF